MTSFTNHEFITNVSSVVESHSLDRSWSRLDGDSSRSDTATASAPDSDDRFFAAAPTNAPQHLRRQHRLLQSMLGSTWAGRGGAVSGDGKSLN